tara:strand:- start:44 stop:736 length:693 start_codon:yes stop_codon:yes gene_type:complete
MKVGLLFGTFNPIHKGHINLAKSIESLFDQIWFIVTPRNPFKKSEKIASKEDRLHMVNIALHDFNKFYSSDLEFNLKSPNYTYQTLEYITRIYSSKYDFSIILGLDNYTSLLKFQWKNSEYILNNFNFFIYKRGDSKKIDLALKDIHHQMNKLDNHRLIDAPLMPISSSMIREFFSTSYHINNNNIDTFRNLKYTDFVEQDKIHSIKNFLIKNLDYKVLEYIQKKKLYIN